MNGYVCFYKDKRVEVYADTSYHAQQKAAQLLNIRDNRAYNIIVWLADMFDKEETKPYTHLPLD